MPIIRQNRDLWDQQFKSGHWDFLGSTLEICRYGVVCSYMKHLGRPISLLDVGCGEGLILRFCEREWLVRYWGLDISQAALDKIKLVLPSDKLVCSTLEEFSTMEKFDIILFNEVLYYTSNPERHLIKFRNYLSPEGFIIISMNKKSDWFSYNNRCIKSVWQFIKDSDWKIIDEATIIKAVPNKAQWKIALIQP